MKKLLMCLMAVSFLLMANHLAMAGNTAQQTVTFQVTAINEISVSGNPGALIINSSTAGSDPDPVSDNSTTYAITTNESSKKITGEINANMPANTTLEITLAAAAAWASSGKKSLSTTATDLSTGGKESESGMMITYDFSATADADAVSDTRTVTLTLTDQ